MYNHDQLRWQYEYGGMRLLNLRFLVCEPCYDLPQIQLRTILIPPDPVPVEYAVPEIYTETDNPVSPIGYSAQALFGNQNAGAAIGTLTNGGGLVAAFDGRTVKLMAQSALSPIPAAGYNNFIGVNWNANISNPEVPAALLTAVTYSVPSFTVYAPTDAGIASNGTSAVSTGIQLYGSYNGAQWFLLYNGTTTGTVGEVFTATGAVGGAFQMHRVAILGAGGPVSVAQVQFNVASTGQNEQ